MKPAPFTYHDPASLPEALELLATLEDARPLAGGQSLVQDLNARRARPSHLVDLRRVPGLDALETQPDGTLVVGAMARQRDVLRSSVVRQRWPLLADALRHVGHRQTRARGTIGGSFAYLHPASELLAAGAAMDVTLGVRSGGGERRLPIDRLAVELMRTSIAADELVTTGSFPAWPAGHGHAFLEVAPRAGTYAFVSVAALMTVTPGGIVDRAAVGISGLGPGPVRLPNVEADLVGAHPTDEVLREVAAAAGRLDSRADGGASAAHRQRLAEVLTRRALVQARERARREDG